VFWKDVTQDLNIIDFSLNKIVHDGHSTFFWLDRWCKGTSLSYEYPHLFSLVCKSHLTVAEVFQKGIENIQFFTTL
jgi:hypothetical protein